MTASAAGVCWDTQKTLWSWHCPPSLFQCHHWQSKADVNKDQAFLVSLLSGTSCLLTQSVGSQFLKEAKKNQLYILLPSSNQNAQPFRFVFLKLKLWRFFTSLVLLCTQFCIYLHVLHSVFLDINTRRYASISFFPLVTINIMLSTQSLTLLMISNFLTDFLLS